MPKVLSDKQGIRILLIRDFLYEHTNEDHYVNIQNILDYLEKCGAKANRKSVINDISRLENDYNMPIIHAGNKGYRVASHEFEPRELRLMIDSVQSARFITETEAKSITDKIKDLSDIHTRPKLNRKAYVNERIRDSKESVVARTDIIHEAMSDDIDSKISFKYVHYKPASSINGDTKRYSKGGEPFIVSPFAFYWNNGNYYLYAYVSEKEKFQFFRIDRMESIKLISEKREGHILFSKKDLNSKRKAKVFDMYSTGNEKRVRLRGVNTIADQVVDAFGRNIMMMSEGKDSYFFVVDVDVDVSPTFFAWVATFGRQLAIVNPPEVKAQMVEFLNKSLEAHSK